MICSACSRFTASKIRFTRVKKRKVLRGNQMNLHLIQLQNLNKLQLTFTYYFDKAIRLLCVKGEKTKGVASKRPSLCKYNKFIIRY